MVAYIEVHTERWLHGCTTLSYIRQTESLVGRWHWCMWPQACSWPATSNHAGKVSSVVSQSI